MSIKLMSAVWETEGLSAGDKLVLLALADQANDEGWQCWPSVMKIAKRSGQGERTVRRCLADLETSGHLTRHHRDGTSTQYHVHPCQIGTPAKSAPLPNTTLTPAKLAGKPLRETPVPSEAKASSGSASAPKPKSVKSIRLPEDWEPEPLKAAHVATTVVAAWEPGRLERELSKFKDHWAAAGGANARKPDWQAAWRNWLIKSDEWTPRNVSPRRPEPVSPSLAFLRYAQSLPDESHDGPDRQAGSAMRTLGKL